MIITLILIMSGDIEQETSIFFMPGVFLCASLPNSTRALGCTSHDPDYIRIVAPWSNAWTGYNVSYAYVLKHEQGHIQGMNETEVEEYVTGGTK